MAFSKTTSTTTSNIRWFAHIDDSIIEKPYTDQNASVCWHFEHSTNSGVKGISLLTAFYHTHHPD